MHAYPTHFLHYFVSEFCCDWDPPKIYDGNYLDVQVSEMRVWNKMDNIFEYIIPCCIHYSLNGIVMDQQEEKKNKIKWGDDFCSSCLRCVSFIV